MASILIGSDLKTSKTKDQNKKYVAFSQFLDAEDHRKTS